MPLVVAEGVIVGWVGILDDAIYLDICAILVTAQAPSRARQINYQYDQIVFVQN